MAYKNKEDKREYDRQWYIKHKEDRKKINHISYLMNKSKRTLQYIEYRNKYKYKYYKISAAKRNIDFLISKEDFKILIKGNCYYCGTPNSNGVDRLDSSKAYIKENCVSCCSMCNIMKNKFSKDDFINQCKKIAKQFENY